MEFGPARCHRFYSAQVSRAWIINLDDCSQGHETLIWPSKNICVSRGKVAHRLTIAPIIVAHLTSWAVCLQSSDPRQGAFPGWNARTRLEQEEQPQHLRRRTVVGAVIPKRSANPWKKIWESLIQWGDFLANENRIDRDPGTLHL